MPPPARAFSADECGAGSGDEYEGQIALQKFARDVDPAQVKGRLLVVPTLSMDASLAGTRTWPDADKTK